MDITLKISEEVSWPVNSLTFQDSFGVGLRREPLTNLTKDEKRELISQNPFFQFLFSITKAVKNAIGCKSDVEFESLEFILKAVY